MPADRAPRDRPKATSKYVLELPTLRAIRMRPSVKTLKAILEAFNRHDPVAIMEFFAEDAVFEMPRGPDPWGQRFVGKSEVARALASRFAGISDVHYGEDRHWVAGDRGVSEWTLVGTTVGGAKLRLRGCDLWEFRDGKVVRKDSFWKIVEA